MELGKDEIRAIIHQIAQEEILKFVDEHESFIQKTIKEVIREEMILAIHDGQYPQVTGTTYYYDRKNPNHFNGFVSGILKQEIVTMLRDQFEVGVKVDLKKPAEGVPHDE